jgi:hypothetical protein
MKESTYCIAQFIKKPYMPIVPATQKAETEGTEAYPR